MKIEVHRRVDKRYGWRLIARNGQTIATDGGQGYENRAEARRMAAVSTFAKWRRIPILDTF